MGEAVDAAKSTVRVVQGTDNIVDAAKAFRRTADKADDIKRSTGAYIILYENGQNYVGKGGFSRAIQSAAEHMSNSNKASSIIWAPTSSEAGAFVTEYLVQTVRGVGKKGKNTFNKIWSPGKNLLDTLQ